MGLMETTVYWEGEKEYSYWFTQSQVSHWYEIRKHETKHPFSTEKTIFASPSYKKARKRMDELIKEKGLWEDWD